MITLSMWLCYAVFFAMSAIAAWCFANEPEDDDIQ